MYFPNFPNFMSWERMEFLGKQDMTTEKKNHYFPIDIRWNCSSVKYGFPIKMFFKFIQVMKLLMILLKLEL